MTGIFPVKGELTRPIFDFKLYTYTGDAKPVCCRQIIYVVYESKNITEYIDQLDTNGYINDYEGPSGTLLLLASKSQQKTYFDIENLV